MSFTQTVDMYIYCCRHLQKSGISGNAKAIEEICDFLNLFENTSILALKTQINLT